MSAPPLDVVVVSYRCRDLLRSCLASLRGAAPAGTRVHVVDNASGDGTVEMLERDFPEVAVTAAGRNLGFAAACNLGIRAGAAPFVLVLNPDTELEPGTLDVLLRVMAEQPRVGVAGCRLERPDGRFDHASRRSFPTILGALGHFTGAGRGERAPAALAQYRAPHVDGGAVDAVNGAFMLIRRAAFDGVGGFDERYWMYMEDLDLCYRLARAGWTTWYEPSVRALHVKGGSSGAHRSARLNVAFHAGMFRFYRTNVAPTRNALVNLAVYGGIAAKLAVSLVHTGARRRIARV